MMTAFKKDFLGLTIQLLPNYFSLVLCGDDTWVVRSVRISSGHLRITLPSAKSPSKLTDKDDVINLKQGAYVHTDLNQSELPNTAKQGMKYFSLFVTGSKKILVG